MLKNFSAGTKHPNTRESDQQPKVWHEVTAFDEDGNKYTTDVYAIDPPDAIRIARYLAPELWTPHHQ